MTNRFGPAALDKAVRDTELPPEDISIGVTGTSAGDVGVQGHVSKDIGAPGGWSLSAAGEWMRGAGGSLMARLRWKGR